MPIGRREGADSVIKDRVGRAGLLDGRRHGSPQVAWIVLMLHGRPARFNGLCWRCRSRNGRSYDRVQFHQAAVCFRLLALFHERLPSAG